jgi:serine/threonine protein kinase
MFVILDLCRGGTLEDMIESHQCLSRSEMRKLIHRDLKPRNIGLDHNGNVRILDFGLAKLLRGLETCAFEKWGTSPYMAPEVFKGVGYEYSVDLWSVGVILYEVTPPPAMINLLLASYRMLTGSLPVFYHEVCQWTEISMASEGIDEARNLLEGLFLQASRRPKPDAVAIHPFLANERHWSSREEYEDCCRLAGVGMKRNGEKWPCVGLSQRRV